MACLRIHVMRVQTLFFSLFRQFFLSMRNQSHHLPTIELRCFGCIFETKRILICWRFHVVLALIVRCKGQNMLIFVRCKGQNSIFLSVYGVQSYKKELIYASFLFTKMLFTSMFYICSPLCLSTNLSNW